MIDVKKFATVYNAFWQNATPTCDLFVRHANRVKHERVYTPLNATQEHSRQSLIAEYAFSKFIISYEIRIGKVAKLSEKKIHTHALQEAKNRLSPYAVQGLDLDSDFSKKEKTDSIDLSNRLIEFFFDRGPTLTIRPRFPGCGYIDMSEGDVLVDSTLYEVKSVDRMIRGSDLRQLVTYAALNKSADKFGINSIGWFNPRRGIYAKFDLEEVCLGISGKAAEVLYSEIIDAVSSDSNSNYGWNGGIASGFSLVSHRL